MSAGAVPVAATQLDRPAGRPARRSPGRVLAGLVLPALPVALLAVLAWNRRWMSDDGFINVRVINNVFAGHGPVFNVGERVEVGTSTLWLVVLGLGHLVTPFWGVSTVAVVAGLLCSVLGVAAASWGAGLLWSGASGRAGTALPLGSVVLVALPPVWDFATSGLETGLTFLWLGTSFLLLAGRLHRQRTSGAVRAGWQPVWPALVLGLGPLVRPDLLLLSAALGVALLAQSRRGVRSWLGAVVAAGALPAGYEVLRAGYYATLVPNTALAKSAGAAAWTAGRAYLDDFAGRYLLVLPLLVAALALGPLLVRQARQREVGGLVLALAPVVGGVLHAVYIVRLGGDFMHGRFLLPATFAMLLPVAVVIMPIRGVARLAAVVPVAVVVAWAVVVGTSVRVPYTASIGPTGIADERGVYVLGTRSAHPVRLGDWRLQGWYVLGELYGRSEAAGNRFYIDATTNDLHGVTAGHTAVVRIGNIGVFGVEAGDRVFVADAYSLADAVGARLQLAPSSEKRAGHSHIVPTSWDLARYATPSPADPQAVDDARAALGCGRLAELHTDITAPLSLHRLLGNLRDAAALTRLRIPGDPAVARQVFCGS